MGGIWFGEKLVKRKYWRKKSVQGKYFRENLYPNHVSFYRIEHNLYVFFFLFWYLKCKQALINRETIFKWCIKFWCTKYNLSLIYWCMLRTENTIFIVFIVDRNTYILYVHYLKKFNIAGQCYDMKNKCIKCKFCCTFNITFPSKNYRKMLYCDNFFQKIWNKRKSHLFLTNCSFDKLSFDQLSVRPIVFDQLSFDQLFSTNYSRSKLYC